MRGAEEQQPILFSYRAIEDRIPADHPLRAMRRLPRRAARVLPPPVRSKALNGRAGVYAHRVSARMALALAQFTVIRSRSPSRTVSKRDL